MQVQSQNEAERLITTFRSGGMAVRVHRVTSEQDFNESLQESNWDLLIVDNRHPEVTLQFSLSTLKKQEIDIPVLLLTDEVNQELRDKAFNLGISDIVQANDNVHFVHAALREMQAVRNRLNYQRLHYDFQELKKRADALLAESDDAIAYVSDGILIKLNDKFAETFAYAVDDLDCASIIDLISDADQERFKSFFRFFEKGNGEQNELSLKGRTKDGEDTDVTIVLSRSTVDGDPCIQITIPSGNEATAACSGIIDNASGLHNRYHLAEELAVTALQIGKGIPSAALSVYRLDGGSRLMKEVGFSGLDLLVKDLAKQLQSCLGESEILARLGDDSIGVIQRKTTDKALKQAEENLKAIENHICELPDRTFQYTCTCAVVAINSKDAPLLIDQAFDGVGELRSKHDRNVAGIYAPKVAEQAVKLDGLSIEETLEKGLFKLLYQPLMSLHGDTAENYEVTLILADGKDNQYPADLIRSGKNSKLDRWIIVEATKALSLHRAKGHNTRITINLTHLALLDDSLAAWFGVAIKAANLTSDVITLQFNEDDVKNNLKSAIKNIGALRAAKFAVSIGQFGDDEEPFKLLQHLTLDQIKFAPQLSTDSKVLKALIAQAKEHHLQTIVPEVDNASMLASMWQMGAHYIQGSYLQLPSPEMNFEFAELG